MYLGEERRAYARAETLLSVVYYDGRRFLKELVRDISAEGVMIESSAPCDVGTLLEMAIDFNNPTVRAKGTVAWMKKDSNSYKLGVQLKEINATAADEWAYFLNRSLGLTA
jgi:hypothetical protein